MLRDDSDSGLRAASARNCRKRRLARIPTERLRNLSTRRLKPHQVDGNVVRLHHVLRILVVTKTPAADFNVEFTAVVLVSYAVPGRKRQHRGRLQLRNISHRE